MPEEGVCHVYIQVEAPYHPIVEDVTLDRKTQKILTCCHGGGLVIGPDAPSLSAAIKLFNNWPEFMSSKQETSASQVRTTKGQFKSCCVGWRAPKCAAAYRDGREMPLDSQYHNRNL